MKRSLALALMLGLLVCLTSAATAERSFGVGGTQGNIQPYNIIPWEDGLLVYTTGSTLYHAIPQADGSVMTRAISLTMDGQNCAHLLPTFAQVWNGPGGVLYAALHQENAYTIYRSVGSTWDSIEMISLGIMPLPWEEEHVMLFFLTCGDGVVAHAMTDLFCWNPDTGVTAAWPDCNISQVFTAGEKLLGMRGENLVQIHLLTQSTSTITTLDSRPEQLAGSPDGRMMAWLSSSIVTCKGDGVADRGGYMGLSLNDYRRSTCLTNTGLFAVVDDGMVYYEPLSTYFDPQDMGLMVSDYTRQAGCTARFRKAHPGVRVTSYSSAEIDDHTPAAAAERIRSGDKSIDVFLLNTSIVGYRAMMEKGFCQDLSGDPEIAAMVAAMPVNISSALMADGKIFAVPYDGCFGSSMFYVTTDALHEMNLSMEDMPTNLDDLMDTLLLWLDEGRFDQVRLSDHQLGADDRWLYSIVQSLYTDYNTHSQPYTSYDTPAYRSLMDKCEQVMQCLRQRDWPGNDAPTLFQTNAFSDFSFHGITPPEGTLPLVLKPFPEDEPLNLITLRVAVMNPLSERPAEALAYLRSAMADMPPEMALYFWPDQAVPVPDTSSESSIRSIEDDLARWEAIAADDALPADERRKAREMIELDSLNLEALRRASWQLSPATIDAYRAALPYITVNDNDFKMIIFRNGGSAIDDRYFTGQVSMDMLLKTYDRIARMIAMEDGVLLQ